MLCTYILYVTGILLILYNVNYTLGIITNTHKILAGRFTINYQNI